MSAPAAVIIVNYNTTTLLKQCLDALARQTLPPSRVIVVDNASSDLGDDFEQGFPWVETIRLSRNAGFAEANNIGIRMAETCEWVCCLNPDAFAEPDWLERLFDAQRRLPEYSFFGCKQLLAENPAILDGTGDRYHVSGLAWRRDYLRPEAGSIHNEGEIFSPCAAAAMYRRAAVLEAGGFDASFFCYFEDVDLAFRLRLLGHRCWYVAAARVHHAGSAATSRDSEFSLYHGNRNLVWSFAKNMPGPMLWRYLPLHLAMNFATMAYFALKGHGLMILRAKWDALRGLGQALRARREVQATRRIECSALRRVMAQGLGELLRRD